MLMLGKSIFNKDGMAGTHPSGVFENEARWLVGRE